MGGESPPGRNERPDEFEVGWPGAKAYGCRQDTDGPAAAAANRCRWDETPGLCEGGQFVPCRSDEIRLASTSSLDRDESESTRDWGGSSPPSQNDSIAWRVAANFVSKSRSWRSLAASLWRGVSSETGAVESQWTGWIKLDKITP